MNARGNCNFQFRRSTFKVIGRQNLSECEAYLVYLLTCGWRITRRLGGRLTGVSALTAHCCGLLQPSAS